jgi:hypothetical protein
MPQVMCECVVVPERTGPVPYPIEEGHQAPSGPFILGDESNGSPRPFDHRVG